MLVFRVVASLVHSLHSPHQIHADVPIHCGATIVKHPWEFSPINEDLTLDTVPTDLRTQFGQVVHRDDGPDVVVSQQRTCLRALPQLHGSSCQSHRDILTKMVLLCIPCSPQTMSSAPINEHRDRFAFFYLAHTHSPFCFGGHPRVCCCWRDWLKLVELYISLVALVIPPWCSPMFQLEKSCSPWTRHLVQWPRLKSAGHSMGPITQAGCAKLMARKSDKVGARSPYRYGDVMGPYWELVFRGPPCT